MAAQKGATGVVVAFVAAVLFLVGGGGYLLLKARSTPETAAAASPSQDESIAPVTGRPTFRRYVGTTMKTPPPSRGVAIVDTRMSKSEDAVYYKKDVKAAPGAEAYVEIKIPDPASLVRIYPNPDSDKKAPGALPQSKNIYTPPPSNDTAYYKDSENVYVLEESSSQGGVTLTIVEAADPATFQLLSDQYAKDSQHVYLITQIFNHHA